MKLSNILIHEAKERPTKTQTKAAQDWDSLFGSSETNLPSATPSQSAPSTGQQPTPDRKPMGAVSGDRTRQRMSSVRPTDAIADKLSQMDLSGEDDISDHEAAVNAGLDPDQDRTMPTVPRNEMSTISTAVVKSEGIVPEWHMVKHLPGYLIQGIRSIGRQVFRPFTTTPIEEIQVLANIGDGPNDQKELDAVMQYLKNNGERDSEAELEFHERIPNYGAKVKIYKALDYTFMVVKDFAGNYIYAWPTKDGDGLAGKTQQPRLK